MAIFVKRILYLLWPVVICVSMPAYGLLITAPTTSWTAISYSGSYPDFFSDQQTGDKESDLVGNQLNPAFYTAFDGAGTLSLTDGTLFFRARLAAQKNPPGYSQCLFVGLDANLDGALDLFLGVDNQGSHNQLGIWNPGSGANTSPNTTSINNPALKTYAETTNNYSWTQVNAIIDPLASSFDVDGGGDTDYFLSFSIPFADVVAYMATNSSFCETSAVHYVMATATQPNSLNQDLNGVSNGVNSASTWSQLGGLSVTYTASGQVIPEPYVLFLALFGLLPVYLMYLLRRSRNRSPTFRLTVRDR